MSALPLTVWLVEDNPGDARLIREYLKDVPPGSSFELRHLSSMQELASLDLQAHCDLILLDLHLADSEGLETLNRCVDIRPEVPVIVLTGLESESIGINAVRGGAQDYLVKDDINPILLSRSIAYAVERVRLSGHLRQERDERHVLNAAIGQLGQGMILADAQLPDCPISFANPAFLAITGYDLDEIIGQNCRFLQGPETDKAAVEQIRDGISHHKNIDVELLNYRKDGTAFWNQLLISPVFSQDGQLTHYVGLQTDVTARREQEKRLELLRMAIDQANESIIISTRLDQQKTPEIVFANHAFTELTGYQATDIDGRKAMLLLGSQTDPLTVNQINRAIRKGESFQGETAGQRRNGESFDMLLNISPVRDQHGIINHHVSTQSDITLRKQYEQQILHDALHDHLTGRPNRVMFSERIAQALSHATRNPNFDFAVFMLDIDQFKIVNDGLGHSAGDQLLIEVAKRIEGILEPSDTLARLGGDDFGIIVEDIGTPYDAARVARRLQRALQDSFSISNHSISATAGIGIVLNSARYENPEAIVRDADTAMYRAKNRGRGQYEIFDTEHHLMAVNRLTLENELRRALINREFRVYFQPIIEIGTNRFAAGEALVRWQHPVHGLVGPGYFLDVAIEAELMEEIGDFVLQESIAALADWRDVADRYGYRLPSVTVNLDQRELASPTLVNRIKRLLAHHKLSAYNLVVEITERALASGDPEPVAAVKALSKLGVRIAIDDFGVGYSTFAILQKIPVNFLKLDRSIIATDGDLQYSNAILRSISSLASELGIRTVAEGIEATEQIELAKSVNIDLAQGYLLGFPAPLSDISAYFHEIAAASQE